MNTTIFMIHGMCCGPWCWENFEHFFKDKGAHTVATSLRFHDADPQAPPHPELGSLSLLDYVADLEEEIRLLNEKPIIMGHSMGGLLGQILAARGLARGLILLAPAAPAGIIGLRPSVVKGFLSSQLTWAFWQKPFRQTFDEAKYSVFHNLVPAEQEKTYERLVFESGRAATEIGYWPFDPRRASRVDAAGVTCPVLVMVGAQDKLTPAAVVKKVAARYHTVSTYKEFPQNGHWLLAEPGWRDVADYAAEWLTRL